MEIINATDGYKLGHHRMYPEGTEQVTVIGLQEVTNTFQKPLKVLQYSESSI